MPRTPPTGKFAEAQAIFDSLLASIPLVVVESRAEAGEVKELLVRACGRLFVCIICM